MCMSLDEKTDGWYAVSAISPFHYHYFFKSHWMDFVQRVNSSLVRLYSLYREPRGEIGRLLSHSDGITRKLQSTRCDFEFNCIVVNFN